MMKILFCLILTLAASVACAQSSWVDEVAKAMGLVAPPVDPPDFVKASRRGAPRAAVPVFAPPPEPRSKVKSVDEVKSMEDELERAARGVK